MRPQVRASSLVPDPFEYAPKNRNEIHGMDKTNHQTRQHHPPMERRPRWVQTPIITSHSPASSKDRFSSAALVSGMFSLRAVPSGKSFKETDRAS